MQQVSIDNSLSDGGGVLDGLNDSQLEAVTVPDGPALVLAGAGTGKTRVLAHRVAYLVHDRHVDQSSIIALTFTNKAAREMRERISSLLAVRSRVWVGTFHAFGLWILRRHHDLAGLPADFSVCGVSDQLEIVKSAMKKFELPTKRYKPRDLLQDIRWAKKRMAEKKKGGARDNALGFVSHIAKLLKFYSKYCADNGLVDFDDLLYRPLELLKGNPDVREKYQERCRYLLIDEYQDTNRIQFYMARMLTAKHGNLFAVGDEDQSIYGWRGADMRNVTQFSKSFPNSSIIRLEQNYRSTQNILDVANSLIKKNTERIGKRLWTDTGSGEKVVLYRASNAENEAWWVADMITKTDRPKGDFAVLFRTNAQSREFEKAFVLRGIPHELVAGTRFYNRREIKDVMAYLRASVRPQDDLSLQRVLTAGAYGIGPKTIESARSLVGDDVSLIDALRAMSTEPNSRPAVTKFVSFIEKLHQMSQTGSVVDTVSSIIRDSGYLKKLKKEKSSDSKERIENVNELLNAVREYADKEGQDASLIGFLNEVALVSDVDAWHEGECGVSVMTIHAAKGLEFPVVFVVGLEEGLMPHSMSLRDDTLEEERRLCYVAMTRAKERLYLSAAAERMSYSGVPKSTNLSRFLGELPRDRIEVYSIAKDDRDEDADRFEIGSGQRLRVGMRVRHREFGVGTVLYTTGKGKNGKVKVKFRNGRTRVFMTAYAGFEVLG